MIRRASLIQVFFKEVFLVMILIFGEGMERLNIVSIAVYILHKLGYKNKLLNKRLIF